ncbi:hypothetical protein HWI79_851 [Cryptosporidium felis]|nr:hypothetical protein HWI79_851 [Cryptosporidium felis]
MINSSIPQNSEFQGEKTLSYVIENDEDYGSKLSKLLAYNSRGVPVLGIRTIQFQNDFNGNFQDLESFLENYFSGSEILNGSDRAQQDTSYEIEDFLASEKLNYYPENQARKLEVQEDGLEKECSELEIESKQDVEYLGDFNQGYSKTPSSPPNPPSESINSKQIEDRSSGKECVNIDYIHFENESNTEELVIREDSEGFGGISDSEEKVEDELEECIQPASTKGRLESTVEGRTNENPSSNFASNSLNLYFESIYGDNPQVLSETISFEERTLPNSVESLIGPHSDTQNNDLDKIGTAFGRSECGSEHGKWRVGDFDGGSDGEENEEGELKIREIGKKSINYLRPVSADLAPEKSINSERSWRMKIENMMNNDRKFGGHGILNHGISFTLDQSWNKPPDFEKGLNSKDLKMGIIKEIENELKGCKLSLGLFREGKTTKLQKSTRQFSNSDSKIHHIDDTKQDLNLGMGVDLGPTLDLNLDDLDLNLDLDLSLGSDQELESEVESNIENKTIYLPEQSQTSQFTYMDSYSNLTTQPCVFSLESLRSNLNQNLSSDSFLQRGEDSFLSSSNLVSVTDKEVSESNFYSAGLHALWNHVDTKPKAAQLGESTVLTQTLILSQGRENTIGQKSSVNTPENIVMSIKLLGVVRDIKRQIQLIKNKLG